jgi:ribonuclease HII
MFIAEYGATVDYALDQLTLRYSPAIDPHPAAQRELSDVAGRFGEETAGQRLAGVALGVVDHLEIDQINILRATHKAMRIAIESLPGPPEHVLIDGLPVSPFPFPQTAIIEGDCISLSIAAASVIAKVTRDMMMRDFCARFPEYCFSQHKGYSTELHLTKLHELGPCEIHRRSFEPVAQPLLALEGLIPA